MGGECLGPFCESGGVREGGGVGGGVSRCQGDGVEG